MGLEALEGTKKQNKNKEFIEVTKGYLNFIVSEAIRRKENKMQKEWLAYDALGLSHDEVAKDGNSLNCSKENLKVSTRREITTVACNNSSYHDAHYKECILEPILVMQDMFTKEELIGFLKGNILKYRLRMGHKDNVQKEMDKIKRYEDWLSMVQAGKRIEL
mgnify:CR=1 FL=1|jgi:hypothetical protein